MSDDIGARFRALHRPGDPFVLANAWDAGSARVLAALGAEAIGTSSAAHAFTLGRPDMGHVTRDEALAHGRALFEATGVPVSGDYENGFADAPGEIAETLRLAAAAGLAGCSFEDTRLPGSDPYPFDEAVERIRVAAAMARSLDRDFVLVARADGVMLKTYGMDEAIRRVVAFEAAGADCVYVPLVPDMAAQAAVCRAVAVPVNALAAGPFTQVPLRDFAAAGVARVSLGSALARATHRVLIDAAQAIFTDGDFTRLGGAGAAEVDPLLTAGAAKR